MVVLLFIISPFLITTQFMLKSDFWEAYQEWGLVARESSLTGKGEAFSPNL